MGQVEEVTTEMQTIAGEMSTELMRAADTNRLWVNRALPHGLQLLLERRGSGYRLALARAIGYPSQMEVDLCVSAFRIPARHETRSKSAYVRGSLLHVTEIEWHDIDVR